MSGSREKPGVGVTQASPMQSIGIDFFQRRGDHYLILMDHFSGLPMFQKTKKTKGQEVVHQLKNWFSLFWVTRLIRADHGPSP